MSVVTEDEVAALIPLAKAMAANKRASVKCKPPIDDLISDATLGLTRAALKYNPSLGVPFRAFAIAHMRWALGQYMSLYFGYRSPDESRQVKIRPQYLSSIDLRDESRKFSYTSGVENDIYWRECLESLPEHHRIVIEMIGEGESICGVMRGAKKSHRTCMKALKSARRFLDQ